MKMLISLLFLYLTTFYFVAFAFSHDINSLSALTKLLHAHGKNKDIRATGYEDETTKMVDGNMPMSMHSNRAYRSTGVQQEFNVSGILKLNPVHEVSCNETMVHYYSVICSSQNGGLHRSRRSFESETVNAEQFNRNGNIFNFDSNKQHF